MRIAKLALLGMALAVAANAVQVSQGTEGESSLAQVLKTKSKSKTGSTSSSSSNGFGIGEFVLGTILIPFAIVFLWKNEKKLVTYAKCMETAEKDCVSADPHDTQESNNFKLVHVTGKTENKTEIVDNDFQLAVENSYRLSRTVEMFQWYETEKSNSEDGSKTYSYSKGWYPYKVDSANFHESGHENPQVEWPFKSNTISAQHVSLGQYRLTASQILSLGHSRNSSTDVSDDQVQATSELMQNHGFSEFQVRGNYLVASTDNNELVGEHIGQFRVCFSNAKCGTTTVIAQQMQDEDEVFTFRKWNPEKIHVPFKESTDAEDDSTCTNPLCCYICLCVNCCFNVMFEEVVDASYDDTKSAEWYFEEQKKSVGTAAKCFRPLGIFCTIFGLYLLFSPIIALLKWIPLVGWLLGGLVSIAAAIFAVIVGGTVSCLVIAVAWVFFRPLIGIPLLLAVGAGIYFIFFFDWSAYGDKTATDTISGGGTTDPKIEKVE